MVDGNVILVQKLTLSYYKKGYIYIHIYLYIYIHIYIYIPRYHFLYDEQVDFFKPTLISI